MAEPKGGLVFIPGGDSSAIAANKAYQDALERLNKSLEARQNRMFDPTMLALAEGFLSPGRTGSFGESLGVAAGKMRVAEEAEAKTEQELAQAKLGLAERGIALEQQRQRERDYREGLQRDFGIGASQAQPAVVSERDAAPVGLEAPTEGVRRPAQQGTGIAPPAGFENAASFQITPANRAFLDPAIHIQLRMKEPNVSYATAVKEANEMQKDRYIYRDNAIFDKASGRIFYVPTGDVVEVSTSRGPQKIPKEIVRIATAMGSNAPVEAFVANLPSSTELAGGEAGARAGAERGQSANQTKINLPRADGTYGSYEIPAQAAFEIGRLITQYGINSPQVLREASKYTGEAAGPSGVPSGAPSGVPGAAAPSPAPSGAAPAGAPSAVAPSGAPVRLGVPSIQEQALDSEMAKLTAQKRVEFNEQQRNKILEASDDASEAMRRASIFRQYADAPDANAIFGILSNDKLMSAAARLVEQGIGVTTPGGRIAVGIPEVQTIIRNLGLSPEQQAKAQVAFQLMVEAQIKMSQYAKGAVSNYEQGLFAQSGINKEDIPGSIRIKSDMITLRGQFDKDVARKFEDSNQDVRTFKKSDWYQNRLKQYDEDLMKVASGNRLRVPGASAPQGSGTQPRLRYNPSTGQWSE